MNRLADGPAQTTHRIGKFTFNVATAPDEEQGQRDERWAQRTDALTAWLLAQWQREQRRQAAERN